MRWASVTKVGSFKTSSLGKLLYAYNGFIISSRFPKTRCLDLRGIRPPEFAAIFLGDQVFPELLEKMATYHAMNYPKDGISAVERQTRKGPLDPFPEVYR